MEEMHEYMRELGIEMWNTVKRGQQQGAKTRQKKLVSYY